MGVTGNTTIPRASEGASEGVLSLLGRLGWEGGELFTLNLSKGVLLRKSLKPPELCCALCKEHPHLFVFSLCWHLLS